MRISCNCTASIFILIQFFILNAHGQKKEPSENEQVIQSNLSTVLDSALVNEYHLENICKIVIGKFGHVVPFRYIIFSEETHSSRLKRLYKKYNLQISPSIDLNDTIPLFSSIEEACRYMISAERKSIELYARLLQKDLPGKVKKVFSELKHSSENHYEEFQGCRN